MTERSIELAVADRFLVEKGREVVEIGAVTPYYWPLRVTTIIDPADPHPDVTDRCSWEDWSVDGRPILSISTFEHMGTGEYGLIAKTSAQDALAKLLASPADFLISFPPGYNSTFDECVAAAELTAHGVVGLGWERGVHGNGWQETNLAELLASSPAYGATGATALAMLIRTPSLDWLSR